jgi:hypothetical protein
MNTAEQLEVISLCRAFIHKRPQLDLRKYMRGFSDRDGLASYRLDSRKITQQLNDARTLLRFCEVHNVNLADQITSNKRRLFIGDDGEMIYHVVQYFPTEYRASVAGAAASAIWAFWRDCCGYDRGDKLRDKARAEFGRGIASRWFN